MEDSKIVDLYWARSEQAITETQLKYGKLCYSIAYNILSDKEDASESVNDTYFAMWNAIPPNRPEVLRTYLAKITRNLSLTKWRNKNSVKRGGGEVAIALDELSECIPSGGSVEEEVIASELAKSLNVFLGTLPETERRVFLCRYWYLEPVKEISKNFGFSGSKVKSMLHRTRVKLHSFLQQEGVE